MAKKKKTTVKKTKTPRFEGTKSFLKNRQTQTVFGFFLVIFSIFLLVAFVSFLFSWKVDQSELSEFANRSSSVKNLLGKIGHSLSNIYLFIKALEFLHSVFQYSYLQVECIFFSKSL